MSFAIAIASASEVGLIEDDATKAAVEIQVYEWVDKLLDLYREKYGISVEQVSAIVEEELNG